jgi:hypothetical protein
MLDPRVRKIAKNVRKLAEVLQDDNPDLENMCGQASYLLYAWLKKEGIKSSMLYGDYESDSHAWNRVGDYYVDVTATQFGCRNRVYVRSSNCEEYVVDKEISERGTKQKLEFVSSVERNALDRLLESVLKLG